MLQEDTNNNSVDIDNINDEIKSYELAFHIVPTVGDGEVEGVFKEIKSEVEKLGKVTASSTPSMLSLAYVMEKTIEAKKRKYNVAYFSWIKFDAEPAKIKELQDALDLNKSILRYLIIKSDDKENNLSSQEVAAMLSKDEETDSDSAKEKNTERKPRKSATKKSVDKDEDDENGEVAENEDEDENIAEISAEEVDSEDNDKQIDKAIDDLVR